MGLGRTGLAAARALHQSGAKVLVWDDDIEKRKHLKDVTIVDLTAADFSDIETLILSPGIPHNYPAPHSVISRAQAGGTEIISDIEVLVRTQRDAGYIGVTGTNGKSTTTALIRHIFKKNGLQVEAGGNFGVPALALNAIDQAGFYVLEMSSYQLELTHSAKFEVSVLLNISADHLDRHGGIEGYINAKKKIFSCQKFGSTAIIGIDDKICAQISQELDSAGNLNVIPISGQRRISGGVYASNGIIYDNLEGTEKAVFKLTDVPALRGSHNAQNVAAAYCVAQAIGLTTEAIAQTVSSYQGLPHRQEITAIIDDIPYINDSKATNPAATAQALACYKTIYWIVGGMGKEIEVELLESYFPSIRRAYLVGESAPYMASVLRERIDVALSLNLDAAVKAAHTQASEEHIPGAVVLLSPACASFDQFNNFEERGHEFCRLVSALPGERRSRLSGGEAA